jgi:hypothetical protein
MNHPYLYPDEAPWTEDYAELRDIWRTDHDHYDPDNSPEDDDYAAWASASYHHDAVDNDALPELEATLTPPCP